MQLEKVKRLVLLCFLGFVALIAPSLVIATGGDSYLYFGKAFVGIAPTGLLWVGPTGGTDVLYLGIGVAAPTNFQATPVSGTQIDLSWVNPNDSAMVNIEVLIRREIGEYPNDPPSTIDGSTLTYSSLATPQGSRSYSVIGLTPGTTYYFRIWHYDTSTLTYTAYEEDWATTTAGTTPPVVSDAPSNWLLDPTCDFWMNVPMAMNIINGIEDKMGIDSDFLCMIISLLLLSAIMQLSFGGMAIQTGEPTGTRTILIPFAIMCVGFIVGPVVGAFPGFFLLLGIVLGLGIAYAWSRA